MKRFRSGFPLVVAGLLLGGAVEAQEATASIFDHGHAGWQALLESHVHEGGLVDYPGIAERRGELDAYWINVYNAYTVQLVLDHWPVDSIKDIGGLFSSVFSKRYIPLQHVARAQAGADVHGRKPLSLGELEHGVLGETARTPMFHFAIVCASASCPELRAEAYVAGRLDEQLAAQARGFLADPSRNDVRIRDGRLAVSRIFDWSEDDFEDYLGGVRGLLAEYGPATLKDDPELADVRLRYRKYDWSLNLWKPKEDEGS